MPRRRQGTLVSVTRDSPRTESLHLALAACQSLLAEARASPPDGREDWTVEELEELVETLTFAIDAETDGSGRGSSGEA